MSQLKSPFPVIAVLTSLILAGCDATTNPNPSTTGGGKGSSGAANLEGSISIEGSSTVEPISLKAKEMFNDQYPAVNISVSGQGTGNGFTALARKECDISDASRSIKASELETCRAAGVQFIELPVAWDGLTVVVNKENNFVKQLTVEQLAKIFRKDMAVKTWKEVDPAWPAEKITIYAPGVASGTHDYFMEVVGKDVGMRAGEDGQITMSEDDKLLVTGVRQEKYAIGFFGYSYFEANRKELKAVPIVNPDGEAVTPGLESIESGKYAPFSRPLFIYINLESYQRAEIREFVDFYLNNISEIVTESRYVPLPAEIYQRGRDHLDKELTGTHFLDEKGDHRSGTLIETYTEDNLSKK